MAKTTKKNKNSFSKAIKNVLVFYRTESNSAQKTALELSRWLEQKSIKVFSHPKQKISNSAPALKNGDIKKLDLVIVLGGDGTYLQAIRYLKDNCIPILSINMGSLGFLSEIRKEDLYAAVSMTLENKMEMRPRAMLDIQVLREGVVLNTFRALNDIVLERGTYSQLINIAMYADSHLVNEVKSDGVLVATPTGSTAYNLAAGGPILHPNVKSIVVTPICPHSLTHRPIIFPDNQVLTLRLLNKKHRGLLNVDGRNEMDLRPGDEVVISRSKNDHFVLRRPSQNYFDLLREKLKFGQRA